MNDRLIRGFHPDDSLYDGEKIEIDGKTYCGFWIIGNLFVDSDQNLHEIVNSYQGNKICHEIIPETASRNTFALDKDDFEIFEGDIVLFDQQDEETRFFGEIIYKNAAFFIKSKNKGLCSLDANMDNYFPNDKEGYMYAPLHCFIDKDGKADVLENIGPAFVHKDLHDIVNVENFTFERKKQQETPNDHNSIN